MKPTEYLFNLVRKFLKNTIDVGRIRTLEADADKWEINEAGHRIFGPIIKWGKVWWVQLLTALFFLYSVKSIADWQVSSPDEEVEDNDEELEKLMMLMQAAKKTKPRDRSIYENL